jgi:glyoxylase-like metal-dependent hydrolase (beta-lactamase superfamily II)
VDVAEIAAGLWRWTAYHDEWKEDVGSVYVETDDGAVVIDPLVPSGPPDVREHFLRSLDRDVERTGGAVHVLVTVFWHVRSVAEVAARYDARVWAPTSGRAAIERRVGTVTDTFRPGEALAGGIESFKTARAAEVVFWLPQHGALVPGDVLIGDGEGGLRLCPASWLPENKSLADLAESLRPLLELPVERVLVSHGEPVLGDAPAKLAAAIDAA